MTKDWPVNLKSVDLKLWYLPAYASKLAAARPPPESSRLPYPLPSPEYGPPLGRDVPGNRMPNDKPTHSCECSRQSFPDSVPRRVWAADRDPGDNRSLRVSAAHDSVPGLAR